MKFPFVGPSYALASVNADLQMCMNLFPEVDESGTGRSQISLVGTPGTTSFTTVGAGPIRALWAGEGRMFCVSGATLYEVFDDGTSTSHGNVGNDGNPAIILSNKNQIGIISDGLFYCDNGAGAVAQNFQAQGFVNTSGTNVDWVEGETFDVGDGWSSIVINGTSYTVLVVNSPTNLTLTSGAGTQTSVPYTAIFTLSGTCDVSGTTVTWVSGDTFDTNGDIFTIRINGTLYTIATVVSATELILTAVPFGAPLTNASFSTAPYVTASSGTFLDTYFIVSRPNSNQFNISNNNDGTSWNPLDFAAKEGYPDNISAVYADHEELWLFGDENTTEVWQDTGNENFPFQRIQGAFIHHCCFAPFSPTRVMEGIAWIGADEERGGPAAWFAQGFQPQRISNYAVEQAWAQYETVDDCVTFTYVDGGHNFAVFQFLSAGTTWVYDATMPPATGWHQRGHWSGTANTQWHGTCHCFLRLGNLALGHYIGYISNSDNNIYVMSQQLYTDNGTQITRQRVAVHLANENQRVFFHRFELMAACTAANVLNPVMDYSVDYGNNFINAQTRTSNQSGITNKAQARFLWWRLGWSRDRVFRLTITDAVPVYLTDGYYQADPGTN